MVKNPPAKQEMQVQSLGHGNSLWYSCLGNPMDRGAWQATVHEAARVGYDLATKQQHG